MNQACFTQNNLHESASWRTSFIRPLINNLGRMKKDVFLIMAFLAIVFSIRSQTVTISGNQFAVGGKQIWFNGINVPWQNWADFGGGFTPAWWNTEFQRYADNKINLARVWIHCNGQNSPTTNSDGSVTASSALFFTHMDSLIAISKAKKVYILPCLWSFDMVKNTNTATYQKFRNLINSQSNIQSYIDNFLIPLVKRYNSESYILAWEICNEPEWMFENAEDGPIPLINVQRLHAMCAAAIHKNSTKFVTTGSACVKWNSYLYQNSGDNAGNVWGDTTLQRVYNDSQAKMDFWQIHWYPWMSQWFQSPYQKTTAAFQIDDRPVLVGESQGLDQCDTYICQTLTQMYENGYLNGFDGVCGWKTPQNDGYGTFENIAIATKAFYTNHPALVYPSGTVVPVTSVSVSPTTASIGVGATIALTATVLPTNATTKTVTWSTSNSAIATVSTTGVVTGVAAGSATITVKTTDGAKTATCAITVSGTVIPVTGISVAPTTASIASAGTVQLTATISPTNASNKNVTWTTNNSAVATVSTTGLVTGVAAGNATITVTTVDGNKTATFAVTVTGTPTSCTFGTPLATALPTLAKSYNYIYVLGTGPSFANVSNFTINWDLANKGLWQFSMNTKDGKPNWYTDLRSYATQTFASVQPAITLTGTGFTGLDGSYYATIDNGNFVLVSKTGGFTIYFSTSATAPVCTKSAREEKVAENSAVLYPNPFTNILILKVSNAEEVKSITVINQLGSVVKPIDVNQFRNNQIEIGAGLPAGIYFIRVNGKETTKTYKVVRR
jgi:hypothetical protein